MRGRPSKLLENPPNRIRETRIRRGLTAQQLSGRLGVSGETIRKWETGDNALSVVQLGRVAEALGVPTHELLNE